MDRRARGRRHLTPNGFHGARHDIYTFRFALAHLQAAKPRVLYLAFDETDDWAHLKRYDLVLDTLHRTDAQLEQLWNWLQSDSQYRGKTTLILTVDHGRGRTAADWMDHGKDVAGAHETWLGCFGPTVTARGEQATGDTLYQKQVAGTVAALLAGTSPRRCQPPPRRFPRVSARASGGRRPDAAVLRLTRRAVLV